MADTTTNEPIRTWPPPITGGGLVAIVYSIALIVAGAIVIFRDGDNLAILAIIFGAATAAAPGLLSYKQSIDNSVVQKATADKVEQIAPAVAAAAETLAVIAPKVEQIAPLADKVEQTGEAVDGAVHEWKAALERISAMQMTISAQERRLAVTEALQRGVDLGKQQLLDDTTAMDIARATDPTLDGQAQTAEPGADGTIEVIAPATIKVVTAPEDA